MNNAWHIALEPIDGRYSKQWLECISREFTKYADEHAPGKWRMFDVVGTPMTEDVTKGGFLDFASTNIWKGTQTALVADLFRTGQVKSGDVFLFTDAWNPAIINVRYMADLLGIP